ncbi:SusD-like starch-binding protein associating with outer membrane [Dyadobacter jejuensis]|uniref:SusD-like starch-binding protein associating with outer membrane n=1 Tax=Dyadobacter jejuensis TaxID=1082580 RepID=A0A316B7H8_9BACT|nr:SusD/RagB family nutrient-binding outer membrane lipoprotein [Dyadobacter jejuensis]PWJ58577.1 SusD-like starch-binding protein associating with outer membrane [Dyadobacter jejuensis]
MKKIQIFIVMSLFFIASCSDAVLNDIDTNPNQVNDAPLKTILPQVQMSYVTEVAGGGTALNSYYLSEANTFVLGNNILQNVQGLGSQVWDQGYLALNDLSIIKERALESEAYTYAGIADVLRAMNLATLTDLFGDIPFSEALRDDIINPSFDPSQQVYAEIQKILDEAIVNLGKDSGPLVPKMDDMYFEGDKTLWIKTAYGLKARLYNRLSNLDGTTSANNALAAISQSFNSDSESLIFSKFADIQTNGNPFSVVNNSQPGSSVGNGIYNSMASFGESGKADDDPRAAIWFTKVNGAIISAPNGTARADFGEPRLDGAYYSKPELMKYFDSPMPLLTFVELKFIESEAYLRLGDKTKANAAYEMAVDLALKHAGDYRPSVSLSDEKMDAYKALPKVFPGSDALTLADIIKQKYIYLYQFQPIEMYNDVRRTGVFEVTDPTGSATRLPYPVTEITRNINTPTDIDNISALEPRTKVFWAK